MPTPGNQMVACAMWVVRIELLVVARCWIRWRGTQSESRSQALRRGALSARDVSSARWPVAGLASLEWCLQFVCGVPPATIAN